MRAGGQDFGVDVEPRSGLRVGTPGQSAQIMEGFWEVRIDGVLVASHDFAVASPFDPEGNAVVYLPGVKAVVDEGTGAVERFETTWATGNRATCPS